MEGRPAVIRTVDLGADRQADYMAIPDEVNPMMGNRGSVSALTEKKCSKHSFVLFTAQVLTEISV